MTGYSDLKRLLEEDFKRREAAYPLLNEHCASRFWLHDHPTERVCLFLHGFTAGPFQFDPMGERLFQAGYNVLVPRLPGHGRAGNWSKDKPPPLPTDAREYLRFAVQWLNLAQRLGNRAIVGGLSGGGTVAAWLALEKAQQVDRAILFAPYLSSSNKVIDIFVQKFNTYFEWTDGNGTGYPGFEFQALRAILEIAQHCLKRVDRAPIAPTFTISSESDKAVNNGDHRHFFEAALKHQPLTWYNRFDKVLDIPHTMMTAAEGNAYQNLLNVMAQAFIESRLTWKEVEEIAFRMTRGRTFPSVVRELDWQDKCSKDMAAMMTLVDKWSIAVDRELKGKGAGSRFRAMRRSRD